MKKQIFKFCVLSFFLTTSQLISAQTAIENPQVTPISPEAAGFAKYGDLNLSSATGQMSYSVPIHNISINGNNWPITLNYNYSGLILEGKPSLSGLGWHLSAGASITKEVRGLPDGHLKGYYGSQGIKTEIDNIIADYENDVVSQGEFINSTWFWKVKNFRDGVWDSETDKYTVSIGGTRFSFKIIENPDPNGPAYIPYFLNNHNFKVEIIMDSGFDFEVEKFIVTGDDGTEYHFNGVDREKVYQEPVGQSVYSDNATTAWMLSQIIYVNGQTIDFNYTEEQYDSYNFSASASEFDLNISTIIPVDNLTGASSGLEHGGILNQYNDQISKTVLNRQILNKITFTDGTLNLSTATIQANDHSRKVYDNITLKDNNGIAINSYDFYYTGNRDVLEEITKNGELLFGFEYFNEHTAGSIPEFYLNNTDKPFDQDDWKYYNNAGNTRAIYLTIDATQYRVNKEPNFSATRTGALKRIIYPTGGFTEVDYEQNQIRKPYSEGAGSANEAYNDQIYLSVDAQTTNSERTVTVTKTFDYPVRGSLSHKIIGDVQLGNAVKVSIQKIAGSNYNLDYCYSYDLQTIMYYPLVIEDARHKMLQEPPPFSCPFPIFYPNPIVKPTLLVELDPDNNCPWYGSLDPFQQTMGCTGQNTINQIDSSRGEFWIEPGTYEFKIDVTHLAYNSIYSEILFNFYDPALDNGGILPDYIDVNVGGIRVKRLRDYNENGQLATVKHYDYEDEDGFSTAILNQKPYRKDTYIWNYTGVDFPQYPSNYTIGQNVYYLNSYSAIDINQGTPVYYKRIKTHKTSTIGEQGYPNGYNEQEYFMPMENFTYQHPKIPRSEDLSKAMPYLSKSRDNLNNIVLTKQNGYNEVQYDLTYGNDSNSLHPISFKIYKDLIVNLNLSNDCYDNPNPSPNTDEDACLKSLHGLVIYKEADARRELKSESTVTQGVTIGKTYTYDSHHQLKSITTLDSQGNESKVEYKYPYDVSETQYNNMFNKNQISTPVEERSYLDTDLLSYKKTDFTQIGSYGYLPSEISNAKMDGASGNLEKQLEITYFNDGNIKEYQAKDGNGPKTIIIWGYDKTLPIAKIENANYTDISTSDISNLQTLSNADADTCLDSESCNEKTLRTALNNLRNLPALSDAFITTYTYNPLIGVTSITDPRGLTSYYKYDSQNRLKFVKNHLGEVLEEYDYHYRLEDLNASLSSNLGSFNVNDDVIISAYVSGGSGNFSYEFTVNNSNINQVTTNSTGILTVTTTSNHAPNFTVTCEITDTQTGQEITKNITIYENTGSSLIVGDIQISPSGLSNKSVGDSVTYTISTSGGSGNLQYEWKKRFSNPFGGGTLTQLFTNNTNTLTNSVTSNDCPSYTIECDVTDLVTNETVTKDVNISVISGCPPKN